MNHWSCVPVRVSAKRQSSKSHNLRRAALAAIEWLEGRRLLSTTLSPTADTFVRNNNYALTNFGASPTLFVKNATSGDSRVAFLKFDLSHLTTLNSAVLKLSGSLLNSLATPVDTGVYAVADTSWIEGSGTIVDSIGDGFDTSNNPPGEMTWNNQPTADATPIATATISRDSYQTYGFDVTKYLQQQFNAGATSVTLALKNVEPTEQETAFISRDSSAGIGTTPQLVIGDATPDAPSAVIAAPDVTRATSTTSETVTVTYSGGATIDPATLDTGNITITPYGGGTPLNVSGVTMSDVPDGTIVATYTVDAPAGTWTAANNGNYLVTVLAGGVQDVSGQGVSAAYGSFHVGVGDTIPPTASVAALDVTSAGGSTYTFNVTYTDNVAIDSSFVSLANVAVTGPIGPLNITGYTLSPANNAAQVTATYTASAPSGGWTAADDGQYLVIVRGNQIFDTAGNPSTGATANFNVAIPVPDTVPPSATIQAADVTSPGGKSETLTVTYNDNVGIQSASISAANITVTGPSGAALPITLANVSGSGQSVVATYAAAAPGGAWSASANGTYTVTVLAGSVTDTSNNPVAATSTTFNVSAAVSDLQPPAVAVIASNAITTAGGGSEAISVTYTDNVAINTASIGLGNLSISGPGGPLTVTGFSSAGGGASVTATYTVSAPGGSWDASADGTYKIAINANQVFDTSGNAAPVTFGSFVVNIPLPNPSDTTFNNGNPISGSFVAEAVGTQPNGKILVIGHQTDSSGSSLGVIQRFNADGTLDAAFGSAGQVVTPANRVGWYAMTIQGANHFIVAGTDNGQFALARYDFSGNLDPTFGNAGVTLTDFGSNKDIAYGIALAPRGRLLRLGRRTIASLLPAMTPTETSTHPLAKGVGSFLTLAPRHRPSDPSSSRMTGA